MSVFGSILSKIFHHAGAPPPEQTASAAPVPAPTADPGTVPADTAPATPAAPAAPAAPTASSAAASAPSSSPPQTVDVAAVFEGLAAKNSQKLDWRHSIVDMMKLLDLDSSLSSRQELAKELHYTGDMSDSAKMNMWLHGEVMKQLAANGGKVPADLRA